jgi:hypothetical protein
MMGQQTGLQERLFYEFRLEDWVPADHLLRKIDGVLDLSSLRHQLGPFYSHTGRPSVDPELMVGTNALLGHRYPTSWTKRRRWPAASQQRAGADGSIGKYSHRSCYVQDPGYLCPNNALTPIRAARDERGVKPSRSDRTAARSHAQRAA